MANIIDTVKNTLDTVNNAGGVPIVVTVQPEVYVKLGVTIVIATTIILLVFTLLRKQ
jgi:hypothetical protein